MDKDYISNDIMILILQEINRGNWPFYSEELFENILLDYVIYNHDRFTMTIRFILDNTDITCTTLHLPLDIAISYIVLWSWYTLYSLSDTDILDTDSWSCHAESRTILYLYWLIKLIKLG